MATATNPETGARLVLSGDQWLPVEDSATGPDGKKAYLAGGKWIVEEAVNTPTSTANAARIRQGMAPTVQDRQTGKYNPEQSTLGYVGSKMGEAALGLAGLPRLALEGGRALATKITGTDPGESELQRLWGAAGLPSLERIAGILGVDPQIKAPSPLVKAGTDVGVDIAQNFAFPGTIAQRIVSGIGSAAGRNAGEGSTAGEITGAIIGGGIAPAVVGARLGMVKDAGSALASLFKSPDEVIARAKANPQFMSVLRKEVMDDLANSLRSDPDGYAAKFAQAQQLEASIPGLRLNLGQQFMAPSIIAKQEQALRASPNAARAAEEANQGALRSTLGGPLTQADSFGAQNVLNDLANTTRGQVDDQTAALTRALSQAREEAASKSAPVTRELDMERAGARALAIRGTSGFEKGGKWIPGTGLKGEATKHANDLMGVASQTAKSEGAAFDVSPVAARARELLQQPVWDDANTTSIFDKVKAFGAKGEQATFDDIRGMRETVNADIASALRSNSPNARAQLRNLSTLKSDIDNVIADSAFEGTKKAYGDFVSYYRHDFSPKFLTGVNRLADKTRTGGDPALAPEKVFGEYLRPNGALPMGRYIKLYGENPEAMMLMRDALFDRYTTEVIKKGGDRAIDETAHAAFMSKYRAPLGVLEKNKFTFGKELNTAAEASAAVSGRAAAIESSLKTMREKDVLGFITDKLGTKTPEVVMKNAFADPRGMAELTRYMNTEQLQGMAEYAHKYIADRFTKDGVVTHKEIASFLADPLASRAYRIALSRASSPAQAEAHLRTMKNVAEAAQRMEAVPVPAGEAAHSSRLWQDALTGKIGMSTAVLGNLLRSVVTTRTSAEAAGGAVALQAVQTIRNNMKNEIYRAIMDDPETGKALLQLMHTSPAASGFGAAANKLIKRVPKFLAYVTGADKFPQIGTMAAANALRGAAAPNEAITEPQ